MNDNIEIIGITTCGTYPCWLDYTISSFYNHVNKVIVVNAGYDIKYPEKGALIPLKREHELIKKIDINNKIIEINPTQEQIDELFSSICIKDKDEFGRSTNMTLSNKIAYELPNPDNKIRYVLKLDSDQILYKLKENSLIDLIIKYPNDNGFRFAQYAGFNNSFDYIDYIPDEFTNDGSLLYELKPNQGYVGQGSPGNIHVNQHQIYTIKTSHMRKITPPNVDPYEHYFKRLWYHTYAPNLINEHPYNKNTGKKLTLEQIQKISHDETISNLKSKGIYIHSLPKDERIPYNPPLVCQITPLEYIKKGY